MLFTAGGCGPAKDKAPCDLEAPTCKKNVLTACGPDGGVAQTDCAPGRCAIDAPVPQCVPSGALPCDVEGDVPTCENGRLIQCVAEAGYRLPVDCGACEICSVVRVPAACVAVETEPCAPRSFQALCVGDRRIECDPKTNRLVESGPCYTPD